MFLIRYVEGAASEEYIHIYVRVKMIQISYACVVRLRSGGRRGIPRGVCVWNP